jgi:PhnB protein
MTTQKDPRPAGVRWMSPYITVQDPAKSVEFYNKAFGFEIKESIPDDSGKIVHAELQYNGELIMLGAAGAYNGCLTQSPAMSGVTSPMSLFIYCNDVDAFYKHALTQGATSKDAPEDMFWGDRMCRLVDPDGYEWAFATNIGPHK